jgi:NTP pyrophosphatase (non-canonical NTP hydrolase)
MMEVSVNAFADKALQRFKMYPPANHDANWEYAAVGLCGEAGEVASLLKELWRGDPVPPQELLNRTAEEAVDAVTYGLIILALLTPDPAAALEKKFAKVNARLAAGGWHKRPEQG